MLLRHAQNLSPSPVTRGSPKRRGEAASPPSLLGKGVGELGLRPAATLTEVLVAIFIMGIGLLALLSLFPLGALSMAQAIKDDRTGHAAENARAIAQMFNIHNDQYVQNAGLIPGVSVYAGVPAPPNNSSSYFLNPYPQLFQRPGLPPLPSSPPNGGSLAPDLVTNVFLPVPGRWGNTYDGPSYPVYVDPIGMSSFQPIVGTTNTPGMPVVSLWVVGGVYPPSVTPLPGVVAPTGFSSIPRMPLSFLPINPTNVPNPFYANQSLDRWCTLGDDITFADTGTPSLSTGAVQRQNRYSWAWLLRRPKAGDPTVVDVTTVVYSGRSLTTLGETPFFPVVFDPSSKFVDIPYQGLRPPVRRGTWILDATMEYFNSDAGLNFPDPHGYFYRVVEVTDIGALASPPYPAGSNGLRLELQTYPKASSNAGGPVTSNKTIFTSRFGNPAAAYGVLIVMENVAEVFQEGQGWKP